MLQRLRNAHVFAPEDLGIQQVLIAADKIVYLGRDIPQIDAALLQQDIDLQGARLLPGFIDAHAHTTGGGGEAGFSTRVPPVPLSEFTSAGVTSVIGLLGTDDETRSTSALIAQTYALREEGLSAWCYTGGYHLPPTTLTGSVRRDIVHIDCVIGVGELALSDHRSSQPTYDELLRVASEVHVAGLMTGKAGIVHLHLGDGQRGLDLVRRALAESELPARVFNPTHCNRRKALFDEACDLAGQSGSWIDVTAFPVTEEEDAWSAEDAWGLYREAGLPMDRITISSDGGGCLPVFDQQGELVHLDYARAAALPETLKCLLERGFDLAEVLPALTSSPAELLRLTDKGRVAVGAAADLVVLDDQHEISAVMALGQWHVNEGKVQIFGGFEQQ